MIHRRKKLTDQQKQYLHDEAGGTCPLCDTSLVTDAHHIVHLVAGGADDLANLIPICPNHHAVHHRFLELDLLARLKGVQREHYTLRPTIYTGMDAHWHRDLRAKRRELIRGCLLARYQTFASSPLKEALPKSIDELRVVAETSTLEMVCSLEERVRYLLALGHYYTRAPTFTPHPHFRAIDPIRLGESAVEIAEQASDLQLLIDAKLSHGMFQYCMEQFAGSARTAQELLSLTDRDTLGTKSYDLSMRLALGGHGGQALDLWSETQKRFGRGCAVMGDAWCDHTGVFVGLWTNNTRLAHSSVERLLDQDTSEHPLLQLVVDRDAAIWHATRGKRLDAVNLLELVEHKARALQYGHQALVARRLASMLRSTSAGELSFGNILYAFCAGGSSAKTRLSRGDSR